MCDSGVLPGVSWSRFVSPAWPIPWNVMVAVDSGQPVRFKSMFLCPVVEPTPVNAVTEWIPSGTSRGVPPLREQALAIIVPVKLIVPAFSALALLRALNVKRPVPMASNWIFSYVKFPISIY
jgi:hypothetical protein